MVSTQNKEVLGVLDLVCQQQTDGLQRLFASVDIVAEKEVVGLWWEAAVLKQPQQVVVLPVDVSAYFDWGFQLEQNWLANKDLACFCAQMSDFRLGQLHLLSRTRPTHLQKPFNDRVDVDFWRDNFHLGEKTSNGKEHKVSSSNEQAGLFCELIHLVTSAYRCILNETQLAVHVYKCSSEEDEEACIPAQSL